MNKNKLMRFKMAIVALGFFLWIFGPITFAFPEPASMKALIVTGQNNHNWKLSSPILRQILEDTGLFKVTIATSPAKGENMAEFTPDFSAYRLVVLDYSGDEWPEPAKKSFLDFVQNGGGIVVYHAADNAFPQWKEFNRIIGLGGWGMRDEKSGPYVFWKDGQVVRDKGPGVAGYHGDQHAFQVITRDTSHPITRGLPERWMHTRDELYSLLRGPAENLHILATAYNDPSIRGSGRHEPVLFTVTYGEGRIFHTVLGHAMDEDPPPAMQCVGFIVTLQRGAEWAATGMVAQKIPGDFPAVLRDSATPDDVRIWIGYRPPDLKKILAGISAYDYGKNEEVLAQLHDYIRAYRNSPGSRKKCEIELVKFLQSDITLAGKSVVCRHLREIGTSVSVPVLEKMLLRPKTSDPARYALEKIADAAAEKALIRGLSGSKGKIRLGIIASLGNRKAQGAVPFLEKGIYLPEEDVPAACVKALGQIAVPGAITALLKTLDSASGPLKTQIASSLLLCMENYTMKKDQEAAAKIYYRLVGTKLPLPVRQAAMRGQIAASGKRAKVIIINALKGKDLAWHAPAIAMVKDYFDDSNIQEVCVLLPKLPTRGQVQLLAVLSHYRQKEVLSAIIPATKSQERMVRIVALKALEKVGNDSTVELLVQHAAQTNGEEQVAARNSLWGLKCQGVNQMILLNLVKQKDPAVQYELILSVGERRIREGLNLLLTKTRSSQVKNRQQAVKSLKSIASPSELPQLVRILLSLKEERDQLEMAGTIAAVAAQRTQKVGRARVVMNMLPAVKNKKDRCILYRTLGRIGDDSSLPLLRQALSDEYADVRDAAARAFSEWPTVTAKQDLLYIAQTFTEPVHKILALRAYIRMIGMEPYKSPDRAVQSLSAVLDLSRPEEKKLILGILPIFASEDALKLAESLVPEAAVAAEAQLAMEKIKKKLENRI